MLAADYKLSRCIMSVNNNGSGQTKADLLLTKVDKLAQQNRTLDAKVEQLARQNQTVVAQIAQQSNSVSAHVAKISQVNDAAAKRIAQLAEHQKVVQSKFDELSAQSKKIEGKVQEVIDSAIDRDMDRDAIMLKIEAEAKELKQELEYLSAQMGSMYREALKTVESVKPAETSVDLDELAAKVADKIVIPSNDIDYETLAEELAKRVSGATAVVDYDELGAKVVENMYIPSAIVEDIDYDVLADKVASKLVVAPAEIQYDELAEKVAQRLYIPQAIVEDLDYDELAKKLADNLPAQEVVSADYIASKVAEQLAANQPEPVAETREAVLPEGTIVSVDEQAIAEKVCEILSERLDVNVDSEEIADRVAKQVGTISPEEFDVMVDEDGCDTLAKAVESKLDYDAISAAVAERLAGVVSQSDIDTEEIARLISEKINVEPISEDVLADKAAAVLSNYLPEIDTDEIAEKVVAALPAPADYDIVVDEEGASAIGEAVAAKLMENAASEVVVDDESVEKISYIITENIKTELAADRDIVIDEEGAEALADIVASKIVLPESTAVVDGEAIAQSIAEKLAPEIAADRDVLLDEDGAEALADIVASKIVLPENAVTVDGEAIAQSVAEKLAPEIAADRDIVLDEEGANTLGEIVASKVVIPESTVAVDEGAIAGSVAEAVRGEYDERLAKIEEALAELKEIASQPVEVAARDEDIDIVLDEEGVDELTDVMAGKVKDEYTDRLENIQKELEELKAMLAAGVVTVAAQEELAPAAAEEVVEEEYEEPVEESVEEPVEETTEETTEEITEEPTEEVTEEPAEQTVEETVEEVTEEPVEETAEEPVEETTEETTEEPAEEEEELVTVSDIVDESEESDEPADEIVEEISETPSEGEIMPDGLPETPNGGVDFANMMKYNRSFIARIIQSTDDQKRYYGQVKNALLAYKKVNSNIAWGAERFNKGRETIARFKIRGKTLCLYLALDPNEFPVSVYHHVDVSDNKSMHGTPMMVKIKSPRGVKKAIRLIDAMLAKRDGVKLNVNVEERDYAAMYPYETIEELIEDGLVKDVMKNRG